MFGQMFGQTLASDKVGKVGNFDYQMFQHVANTWAKKLPKSCHFPQKNKITRKEAVTLYLQPRGRREVGVPALLRIVVLGGRLVDRLDKFQISEKSSEPSK